MTYVLFFDSQVVITRLQCEMVSHRKGTEILALGCGVEFPESIRTELFGEANTLRDDRS